MRNTVTYLMVVLGLGVLRAGGRAVLRSRTKCSTAASTSIDFRPNTSTSTTILDEPRRRARRGAHAERAYARLSRIPTTPSPSASRSSCTPRNQTSSRRTWSMRPGEAWLGDGCSSSTRPCTAVGHRSYADSRHVASASRCYAPVPGTRCPARPSGAGVQRWSRQSPPVFLERYA